MNQVGAPWLGRSADFGKPRAQGADLHEHRGLLRGRPRALLRHGACFPGYVMPAALYQGRISGTRRPILIAGIVGEQRLDIGTRRNVEHEDAGDCRLVDRVGVDRAGEHELAALAHRDDVRHVAVEDRLGFRASPPPSTPARGAGARGSRPSSRTLRAPAWWASPQLRHMPQSTSAAISTSFMRRHYPHGEFRAAGGRPHTGSWTPRHPP